MGYWVKYIMVGLLMALLYLLLVSDSDASYQMRLWLFERLAVKTQSPTPSSVASASYAEAISRSAPSVVSIRAVRQGGRTLNPNPTSPNDRFLENLVLSTGSGVILDSRGYVVTNYHVINGADSIIVRLSDGRQKTASTIGFDIVSDIAVLFIDLDNLPTPLINLERENRTGDIVFAIGNPYGKLDQTVTMGIISAIRSNIITGDLILQIDASVHPGNSGGALINAHGELIGFTSQQATTRDQSQTTQNGFGAQSGINFGIPYKRAEKIINELITKGKLARGWGGITVGPLTIEEHRNLAPENIPYGVGLRVTEVDDGGPAEVSGLLAGDFIAQINGNDINFFREIHEIISESKPGDTLTFLVYRNLVPMEISVILTETPEISPG